jgi:hypothetical protein
MARQKILATLAAGACAAAATALVPSIASAQDWGVPGILAAPIAVAEAPFVVADALLGVPPYYPAYVYPTAGPVALGGSSWDAYCAAKYRSFDPVTGTFMGYDGLRHYCR